MGAVPTLRVQIRALIALIAPFGCHFILQAKVSDDMPKSMPMRVYAMERAKGEVTSTRVAAHVWIVCC